MRSKPEIAPDSAAGPTPSELPFTGYFFKAPSEIEMLVQLTHAELKVYLVVTQAIQRDRNGGLLAISQIAKRAHLSERHARKAAEALCQRRWLLRVNRATGAELTSKEEWNGRTVTYANPIQWKQKDASNLSPTGQRSGPESDDGNALRNDATEMQPADCHPGPPGEGNLRPVGEGYLRPVGQRHSESSEYLERPDFKHAQPQVEPSAFSGLSFQRSDTHKLTNGFASAKSAEGSPDIPLSVGTENKTNNPKADAPAKPAGGHEEKPPRREKSENPTPYEEAEAELEDLQETLSAFTPAELEDHESAGSVPDWVVDAALNSAMGASVEAVSAFLRQKANSGWQPQRWTAIPALIGAAFTTPPPKSAQAKAWTPLDVENLEKWLSAFMDGEPAPPKLVFWIVELATEHGLGASDIRRALDSAWKRHAAPGERNAPRTWNWFYEILRAAFVPGYAARLPEAPAAPRPEHHSSAEQLQRGMEALDGSLVASFICPRCSGEFRQYADRVEGTCVCGRAKPVTRAANTQMPTPGKRCAAGGGQK